MTTDDTPAHYGDQLCCITVDTIGGTLYLSHDPVESPEGIMLAMTNVREQAAKWRGLAAEHALGLVRTRWEQARIST